MKKEIIFAVASLVGAIIGVGVFGIPYVSAKAGFMVGAAYIVILGTAMATLHLMYGEVVERTNGIHRLAGYAERYLSPKAKGIVAFSILFGGYAGLLLYIIASGYFLDTIFPGVLSPFWWSIVFWFFGAILIWKGIKAVARGELILTAVLVATLIFVIGTSVPHINLEYLREFNPSNIFLPYGVVLFAVMGIQAIPEIRTIFTIDGKNFRNAIILGTFIPVLLYLLFNLAVVGVSGVATSPEAIQGLVPELGLVVTTVGALFGLLAVGTSFLLFGIALKNVQIYDIRIPGFLATGLTIFAPIILFFIGLRELIPIIGFTGAVMGALDGVVVALIYLQAKKNGDKEPGYKIEFGTIAVYTICMLLVAGAVYEIYNFVISL
ncbi:MAG: hypothetical protein HYV65_01505 [Candidatus Spechtbacteria bacterium]|nr:hypothetical protein [Candidatus Spechtbacteria bacterium]